MALGDYRCWMAGGIKANGNKCMAVVNKEGMTCQHHKPAKLAGLAEKKEHLLSMLDGSTSLTEAARATGVAMRTVYGWKQDDREWGRQVEKASDIRSAVAEEAQDLLRRRLEKGDASAAEVIFALKQDRYTDKQEVKHTGGTDDRLTVDKKTENNRLLADPEVRRALEGHRDRSRFDSSPN